MKLFHLRKNTISRLFGIVLGTTLATLCICSSFNNQVHALHPVFAADSSTTKDFAAKKCSGGTVMGKDDKGNDTGVCVINPTGKCDAQPGQELNSGNCAIIGWVLVAIDTLSAIVGIVVVIMIIVGGIQYSSAGDDPQKIAQAKSRITNAIIALVTFLFMFAFLQWLVPGGIL